jgi:hypothetical protein
MIVRAAESRAEFPDELVMDWLVTRPDAPIVKATPTEPVTPAARAEAG